ncbi:transposase [Candidatus Omnitrophota bacterium]
MAHTRILIENACYHIFCRGNRKEAVFLDDNDYTKYLLFLKKAKKIYFVQIYSYCLMPNHVHLLARFGDINNISKFMRWVNRGYTAFYNAKYEKVGHLWQGRYKSKPIINEQYAVHCAEYIENNPVRSGITTNTAEYSWSSIIERCLTYKKSSWMTYDFKTYSGIRGRC